MKNANVYKAFLLCGGMLFVSLLRAQELYVFTESASNMPAHSISGKMSVGILNNALTKRMNERLTPEIMFGLNKKLMVHGALTFSDMFTKQLGWESVRVYGKYRVFSQDEVHRHFRVSIFGEVSHSVNAPRYDELSFEGDQSGAQGGVILTQLSGKLALSSTLGYLHVLSAKSKVPFSDYPLQAFNYSLSAGYLVLPREYTSFGQTNLNVYTELLGQRSLDRKRYSVDLAPAIQLIFNSNAKLNLGYRFQVAGNMNRMADQRWLIAFERTFLNAIKRKK